MSWLEVCCNGCWSFMSHHFHIVHVACHLVRTVFGAQLPAISNHQPPNRSNTTPHHTDTHTPLPLHIVIHIYTHTHGYRSLSPFHLYHDKTTNNNNNNSPQLPEYQHGGNINWIARTQSMICLGVRACVYEDARIRKQSKNLFDIYLIIMAYSISFKQKYKTHNRIAYEKQ